MEKVIDAHLHFCRDAYFDAVAQHAGHENTKEHLHSQYQQNGICHGIVMGNRDLALKNHNYPDFLSYCIGLDDALSWKLPESLPLIEQHLRRKNCVGIKLYPGYCHYYVHDEMFAPLYEMAEFFQKPVAIHTGETAGQLGRLKYSHPLTVDDAASRFPRVQFVLCHFGNPWLVDAAAVLAKNDNVAADLSGLLEGQPDLEEVFRDSAGYIAQLQTWLHYAGAYDRVLYGTDWPIIHIKTYLEFIRRIVPEQYHSAVFFENANRIYRLGL
jgi:predicted TIM-barrel fold metal-dependent hydrolase